MKKKALKFKDDVVDKSAKKLAESGMVLNTQDELEKFIEKKMCDIDLKDLKAYKLDSLPTLVVFETEKVAKTVEGEEKISTIVKSLSLNIEEAIENI